MLILGIETSCDETSAAVVENGWFVRSCTIASSRKDFERMGGVVPEDAARKQLESIMPTIQDALKSASVTKNDIDAIAVTVGPGLLGSLLVGTTTAHVLAKLWKKKLIPVHHTLGHLFSAILHGDASAEPLNVKYPVLTLSVSGGHTDIWLRTQHIQGTLLGTTRDDAAGEAFDKGAVLLGLPYPGGPEVEKLALGGKENAYKFPNPLSSTKSLEFSFSGLKTALKYALKDAGNLNEQRKKDMAASFQAAIVRHMTSRLEVALELHPEVKEIHLVGGVSANQCLRKQTEAIARSHGIKLRFPQTLRYCTDNAAMIASAGYYSQNQNTEQLHNTSATATFDLSKILS